VLKAQREDLNEKNKFLINKLAELQSQIRNYNVKGVNQSQEGHNADPEKESMCSGLGIRDISYLLLELTMLNELGEN
jgi:hypothetical protein